jgi:hypothetical protein
MPIWLTAPSTGQHTCPIARRQRSDFRFERAGEKGVEIGIGTRIRLERFGQIDLKTPNKTPDQPILKPRQPDASQAIS